MNRGILFILILYLIVLGCSKKTERPIIINSSHPVTEENIVADTIIYSVLIRNFDENDFWADERLKYTQAKKIIETVFDNVYNHNLQVYDYFTNKRLSVEEVKQLENSEKFSRELIQELQFQEVWFMDSQMKWFHKEVLSINMGYATYNSDGTQRGLKPVFRFRLDRH